MFPNERVGFTLIEMLIVIIIISLAVAVVAPFVSKEVQRVNSALERKEKIYKEEYIRFLSFITDSNCRIDNSSSEIICGEAKYAFNP